MDEDTNCQSLMIIFICMHIMYPCDHNSCCQVFENSKSQLCNGWDGGLESYPCTYHVAQNRTQDRNIPVSPFNLGGDSISFFWRLSQQSHATLAGYTTLVMSGKIAENPRKSKHSICSNFTQKRKERKGGDANYIVLLNIYQVVVRQPAI